MYTLPVTIDIKMNRLYKQRNKQKWEHISSWLVIGDGNYVYNVSNT